MTATGKKPEWTESQKLAIRTTGQSLLVSAAAGSGKTAVLAERCAHLVCDATPRCNVDQLLVVTFTRAAAAQMRSRIEAALRDRLASKHDHDLARQLSLIDRAEIGTLHSICGKIIRRHYAALGIDPAFSQLDEHDALLLRMEVARTMFEGCYATDDTGDFQRFLDEYAGGQESKLRSILLRTYDLMMSTVDPAEWSAAALARLREAAEKPIEKSELGRELVSVMLAVLESLEQQAPRLQRQMKKMHPPYVGYIADLGAVAGSWKTLLVEKGVEALRAAVVDFPNHAPQLPRAKKNDGYDPELREAAQKLMKPFREEFGDRGTLASLSVFTEQEWRDGVQRTIPAATMLLRLVAQFEKEYTAAKLALRAVDFTDLERLALQVLREATKPGLHPSSAARVYQEQFHHVLVDEYQDINALQDAILHLLSRESAGGKSVGAKAKAKSPASFAPNLFCVGDVKQSIYRFRLADPHRFLARENLLRKKNSPLGTVIDLSENFRSTPPVIDAVNAVFKRLMSKSAAEIEYDASHELRPGHKAAEYSTKHKPAVELHLLNPPTPPPPGTTLHQFNQIEREAAITAGIVRDLMADTKLGVKFGDVAVLLRAMQHKSQQFAAMLRRFGIPVHTESANGFFEATEIQDLLALLRVLDNPLQDIPLAALLRSPICRIPNAEDALAQIRLAYNGRPVVPFHRAVLRYSMEKTGELAKRLSAFRKTLARWRESAHSQPLHEVLPAILDETGFVAFCSALPDGAQRVANINELLDLARQFGSFQKQGVRRFLDFLLTLEEEKDLGRPSLVTNPGDVVRVMSIHKSKGLQFPIVIVPDLAKGFNLQDAKQHLLVDREIGVAPFVVDLTRRVRYPSLASLAARDRITRDSLAEEMRVLYVAMTRAEEKLILIASPKKRTDVSEVWEDRWADHQGPLPTDEVLLSSTPLDWLGPAYAMITAENPKLIALKKHDDPAVEAQLSIARKAAGPPPLDPRVEKLQPIDQKQIKAPADEAIAELTWQNPMQPFATLPAALAVTAVTKTGRLAEGAHAPSLRRIVKFTRPLPQPRFASGDADLKPLEIGSATHLVMQVIDLATPPTRPAVDAAIGALVDRKFISAEQAAVVDREAVVWFLGTPLGTMLRDRRQFVLRELPVFAPAASDPSLPKSDDPRDRVMLRGQIDALLRTDEGLIVIDYKTDRVTLQTLPQRVDFYREQIRAYADVISRVAGLPVVSSHLAFMHVRRIVPM